MKIKKYTVGSLRTNCYIMVSDEGSAAIIDPGHNAPMLLEELKKESCSLKYILLTHGHVDHIGAVEELHRETGAKIACFEDERELLEDPSLNLSGHFGEPFSFSPHITLKEGEEITVGEISLKVLHTPGHTVGSCIFLGDDFMFSGDTLFKNSVGRTDLPTGSSIELSESIKKIKSLEKDYLIYPGHYDNTYLHTEIKFNPYLN